MKFSEFNDEEKKISLLSLLIKMAKVDMEIHTNENQFIYYVAEKFNISVADVILLKHDLYKKKLVFPKAESERLKYFYYVLTMMKMDKIINDEERKASKQIGLTLGINPLLINDLIDLIVLEMDKDIPDEKITSVITRYLN